MTISPLLVKASADREICNVTPESAGWTHVGFRALRLKANESETVHTGTRELCVVVLTGTVRAEVGAEIFEGLGSRDRVFDDVSPDALYVPGDRTVTLTATRDAEVALCTAPYSSGRKVVKRLDGSNMRRTARGEGSNRRYVCDILMGDNDAADRLLVVEVITPASHSSSYPPHKHDTDSAPNETVLEETYYHRINPPQGFAFQRVYTDDRSLDEACVVEDGDVVMVPRGYHPVVAPHGYDLYYLNVMAGPSRAWAFKNDPAHEWMLQPTT
ncbi:5-deoxy-glucuronate isomerase [Paraburkholderia sp. J67]|uniref:5-deoxy-glucuronate isomerase n=1 Tax=Paraburkholderia sp. J67 TaxID=2805435 RepID=UPI002ABDDA4D|nr:5-deoxy-glucuronate isomerase [Paraburkholderia sp. J67]